MRRSLIGSGLAAATLIATVALHSAAAAELDPEVIIRTGQVALTISGEADITGVTLGEQRLRGRAGLTWAFVPAIAVGAPQTPQVEHFTSNGVGAASTAWLPADNVRVTHDFHPLAANPNLYEVRVTVENLSPSAFDARYERSLHWPMLTKRPSVASTEGQSWTLTPSLDGGAVTLFVAIPPVQPGGMEVFRLFIGSATSMQDGESMLASIGGTLVSALPTQSGTLILGHASGDGKPDAADAGSSGGGGSNGGGTGGSGRNHNVQEGSASRSPDNVSQTSSGDVGANSGSKGHANDRSTTLGAANTNGDIGSEGNSGSNASDNVSGWRGAATPLSSGTTPVTSISTSPSNGTSASNSEKWLFDSGADYPPAFGDLGGPAPTETPELGSLALLGSGLLGMGGYALNRWRGRRPPTRE